jgi:phage-related protein
VTITGFGSGGKAVATVSSGAVSAITITDPGGYEINPTLTITGGGGSGATAAVVGDIQTGDSRQDNTHTFKSGVISQYVITDLVDVSANHYIFELSPSLQLMDKTTETNRQMATGLCSLKYRTFRNGFQYTPVADGGCPYGQQTNGDSGYDPAAKLFDRNNKPTSSNRHDYCNKTIRACRLRWASGSASSPLPFMGQFKAGTPGTIQNERD